EIIAITLGTVTTQPIGMQLLVLSVVALMITVGVYGLVAGIVKLDDGGLHLSRSDSAVQQHLGRGILWFAPYMMKPLSIVGTAAMFLVGGGILTHGIVPVQEAIVDATGNLSGVAGALAPILADGVFGIVAGGLLVLILTPVI